MRRLKEMLVTGLALGLAACAGTPAAEQSVEPVEPAEIVVIAHRGASGYLPEHTLAAYQLAIDMGADFIEPDLVMTSDGVLVARHDPWLSDSTDIADHPEFADRRTTLTSPEGVEMTDWFVWDFTYEEIRTLRARQARAGRDTSHDGEYQIPSFEDILSLAMRHCHPSDYANPAMGSEVNLGIYPETKWPTDHNERGLDMAGAIEGALLTARKDYTCQLPTYIQSFEDGILRDLSERDSMADYTLVQLVYPEGYALDGAPSYALEDIAEYADGVGPFKSLLFDLRTGEATDYARRARALGLEVHTWTLRDDDIAPGFESPQAEIEALLEAGATGIFTDFPDTGRAAADNWLAAQD